MVSKSSWSQKTGNWLSVWSDSFLLYNLEFQACLHIPTQHANHKRMQTLYQCIEDLWNSRLWMYGLTTSIPKMMKEFSHAANTLRVSSQGFEVVDFLVKLFPILVLENFGNGKWQNLPQEVLLSINTIRQTAYEGIFLSCRMYPVSHSFSRWSVYTWQNNTCSQCLQCSDLFWNWKQV